MIAMPGFSSETLVMLQAMVDLYWAARRAKRSTLSMDVMVLLEKTLREYWVSQGAAIYICNLIASNKDADLLDILDQVYAVE